MQFKMCFALWVQGFGFCAPIPNAQTQNSSNDPFAKFDTPACSDVYPDVYPLTAWKDAEICPRDESGQGLGFRV